MTEEGKGKVSEFELMAYVDRQLDATQRLEVEDYLAGHPELAAQIMADLRTRDALRMASCTPQPGPSSQTAEALRRLDSALARQRSLRLMRWPAFAALAGVGWMAFGLSATATPSIIDDAVMAHRTALLRAGMHSQLETAEVDSEEIGRVAHVRLPAIPDGWRITDVQLFPSDDGPGVQVALDLPGHGGAMSLFAVESSDEVPTKPTFADRGTERVAYWRRGQTAFALTGTVQPAVGLAAIDLADNPLR